jgi:hypothetical protein
LCCRCAGGRQLRLTAHFRLNAKPRKWVLRMLQLDEEAKVSEGKEKGDGAVCNLGCAHLQQQQHQQ